jgi:hypothetical protein
MKRILIINSFMESVVSWSALIGELRSLEEFLSSKSLTSNIRARFFHPQLPPSPFFAPNSFYNPQNLPWQLYGNIPIPIFLGTIATQHLLRVFLGKGSSRGMKRFIINILFISFLYIFGSPLYLKWLTKSIF